MILSHRHKFIFLKTRKTAGTSIEIALTHLCDENDVVTPISIGDESSRLERTGQKPRNYILDNAERPLRDDGIIQPQKNRDLFSHIRGIHLRNRIDSAVWASYFKFAVVRNPWEQQVSWFHWNAQLYPERTFDDVIRTAHIRPQNHQIYMDNKGRVLVDKVVEYSNLRTGLSACMDAIGVPDLSDLPRAKSGLRVNTPHWSTYYTPQTRKIIAELFAPEIELMGYTFEG